VLGPVDRLCADDRTPRPALVDSVLGAARAVSHQLEQPR
jgi:hypothetical protein